MDSLLEDCEDHMALIEVSGPGFKQSVTVEELYQYMAERLMWENPTTTRVVHVYDDGRLP